MKILDTNNTPYDLDTIPEEIDDIRYCVLDAADRNEVDFYFLPLVFLESFHAPAICLQIGNYELQMPMDWSIMICDSEFTALEIVPLVSLNNRGFRALCTNPMTGKLENEEIHITGVYQDVKWHFPKLKHGHILAIPLENKASPRCAYFVKDANKTCELDLSDII